MTNKIATEQKKRMTESGRKTEQQAKTTKKETVKRYGQN